MFVWIVFILIVIVGLCSSSKNDSSGKGNSRNDNSQKSFEGFDDGNLPAKEDLDMLLDDPDYRELYEGELYDEDLYDDDADRPYYDADEIEDERYHREEGE